MSDKAPRSMTLIAEALGALAYEEMMGKISPVDVEVISADLLEAIEMILERSRSKDDE